MENGARIYDPNLDDDSNYTVPQIYCRCPDFAVSFVFASLVYIDEYKRQIKYPDIGVH